MGRAHKMSNNTMPYLLCKKIPEVGPKTGWFDLRCNLYP